MTGTQQELAASKWRFLRVIAARKDLNATDLRVCMIVADLFNVKKGRAWPSYQHLCNATGAPRSAIARSIKKLDQLKIIRRISGGHSRSNSYLPDFNIWDGENLTADPQEGWSTQRDSGSPTSGTEIVPPAGPNTLTTPRSISGGGCSSVPAGDGAPPAGCASTGGAPGFEAFWSAYPKKERRQQTLLAYGRALAVAGVTPELLAAKAVQYALAKSHLLDPRWIKSPTIGCASSAGSRIRSRPGHRRLLRLMGTAGASLIPKHRSIHPGAECVEDSGSLPELALLCSSQRNRLAEPPPEARSWTFWCAGG
jgi:hypothetical protein